MSGTDTGDIAIRFISADGESVQEIWARDGDTLLDVGQAAGQPLEGTCEGQMACSTCHVIVDAADFAKLPRASEAEEDMLDLAAAATRTSRLSCQITLKTVMKGLTVRIPSESHNMQGV
ncbi:2Fe-2S iron-sulfur cluster-binding protein [Sphingobium sufflavum]|uniref:2Fe-2S iron-sulfur cluster-binding protein n=1 Tax=Sphingobium sufflavum TaxID=1129547 RepID=UPI001F2BBE52|nr:2Fe-2S iron-sulfur cluster-binding protein [Sphingobium sufflavum]MCE7797490.1 2Fe-2S iron-sulfur cluster-binding protein [Sphingobium sufflavum]